MLDAGWIAIPATPIGLWIVVRGARRRAGLRVVVLQLVILVHVAAVAAVAFFPFPYQRELIEDFRAHPFAANNFVPLVSLLHALATVTNPSVVHQSIGNFLLLMPMGVYLPLLMPGAKHGAITVLAGLAASLGIELGQLAISAVLGYTYKIADIDDVILNTAGVAVGFGIYWVVSHLLLRRYRADAAGAAAAFEAGRR